MGAHQSSRVGPAVVRHPLWWTGWRPGPTIAGAQFAGFALGNGFMIPASFLTGGNGLITLVTFSVAGLLFGVTAWALGVREVNRRADHVLSAFRDISSTSGDEHYELLAGRGTKPLIRPAKEYTQSRLTLTDSSLTIRRRTFDAVRRRVTDQETISLPRDGIVSISAIDEALVIETDDETYRLPGTHPDAAEPATVADRLDRTL